MNKRKKKTTCLAGVKKYEILSSYPYTQPYNNLDSISVNNPFNIHKFANIFLYEN